VKVSDRVNVTNWQQFEPGGEKLKELVEAMKITGRRQPYGYIINAPGGDQVGVMYITRRESSHVEIRLKGGTLLSATPHNDNSPYGGPG